MTAEWTMSRNIIQAKTVIIGSTGVGKTSVVLRYVSGGYNTRINPTIGASFFTCRIDIDTYEVKLQVWDTAGQERFKSMTPLYYRNANAALLVYDMTSRESFEEIQWWVGDLKKHNGSDVVLCVVGNKSDLAEQRVVSLEEAQDFAISLKAFHFETSAANGTGVDEVFLHIAKSLIFLEELHRDPNTTNMDEPDTSSEKCPNKSKERTITLKQNHRIIRTRKKCCIS